LAKGKTGDCLVFWLDIYKNFLLEKKENDIMVEGFRERDKINNPENGMRHFQNGRDGSGARSMKENAKVRKGGS